MTKPKDLTELEGAMDALRNSIEQNTPLEQLAATNAFFMQIMRKCGNGVLTEVVISLVSRVNFLRAQALLHQGWGVVYAQEIEDILIAVRERNPDSARTATHRHIASACAAAKQVSLKPELAPMTKTKTRGTAAKPAAKQKPGGTPARANAKTDKGPPGLTRRKASPTKRAGKMTDA